jgi:hypothetical protein
VSIHLVLFGRESVVTTSHSVTPSLRGRDIGVAAPSRGVGLDLGTVAVFEDSARVADSTLLPPHQGTTGILRRRFNSVTTLCGCRADLSS